MAASDDAVITPAKWRLFTALSRSSPRGQPGGRQVGEPGGVVRVGVAAPYIPDMGRVRQNWL